MAGKSARNWTRENKFSSLLSVGEGLWNAGWREMFFWAHVIWLIDKRVISNIKKLPKFRSKLFWWAFSLDSISFLKRRAIIATRFPRLVYRIRRENLQEHSKATPLLTFRVSFQFFHRWMYVREQKGSTNEIFFRRAVWIFLKLPVECHMRECTKKSGECKLTWNFVVSEIRLWTKLPRTWIFEKMMQESRVVACSEIERGHCHGYLNGQVEKIRLLIARDIWC